MNSEVDRVARLIASLSQMAPRGRVQIADVDLDALVAEFLPVLRRIPAAERIGLAHRSGTDVPRARANQDYLKQVLINLVRNAAEAMPEGGAALVSTEREEAEGPGGAARATLVVEDTGPGIAEGIRGRLFEPFVTSKGAEHRGLGLSVARALVEQLGGSIRWEAGSEGRGSRFVVTLPSAPAGQEGVRGS
jgi:signal transduction histidine kinase